MQWLRSLFGSAEPAFHVDLVNVKNRSIKEYEEFVTFCMQAQIEQDANGSRLGFRMSPSLANVSNAAARNPLAALRDRVCKNADADAYIVLLQAERVYYHSEIPADVCFVLKHWYEEDPSAEAFVKMRDEAYSFARKPVVIPISAASKPPPPLKRNDNNEVHLGAATDNEAFEDLLQPPAPAPTNRARTQQEAQQALQEMDRVNAAALPAGGCNAADRDNVIELGWLRANHTAVLASEAYPVYRASLEEEFIKLYAGQDQVVVELNTLKAANAEANLEGNAAQRAIQPLLESSILPATHPLVIFIGRCCRDLPERQNGFKLMTTIAGTDRSEECYYRVSRALLEEARRLIVIGIFTRMRYTRLRDCHIVRQYESAAGESALLHLVANKFGLKVTNAGGGNGATVHVADWGPGAYRPTVSMTLRIRYIVVDGVSATAAALYNSKKVRLVPVANQDP